MQISCFDPDYAYLFHEWLNVKEKFHSMEEELTAFREWFHNLDVSEEVAQYLAELDESGRLAEILGGLLEEEVTVIVPGAYPNGTCGALVNMATHTACVVDLGNDEGAALCNRLSEMGVTNVTFFNTHMHDDHCTEDGFTRLLTNFAVNAVYWCQPDWSKWDGRNYKPIYDTIEAQCNYLHIPVYNLSTEGEELATGITHLKCHAYNCSEEAHSAYYGNDYNEDREHDGHGTDLNNFSVCYRFDYGLNSITFTGDVQLEAMPFAIPAVTGAKYYTVAHHGLNVTSNPAFVAACNGVGIVGAYGAQYAAKIVSGYPDTVGKKIATNAARDVVVRLGLYNSSIDGDFVNTDVPEAGYYLEPGTDLFTLAPGYYYSPNEAVTQTLIHAPAFTSGFILEVRKGARSEYHYNAESLYNWHSNSAKCNKSVGTWSYFKGERNL